MKHALINKMIKGAARIKASGCDIGAGPPICPMEQCHRLASHDISLIKTAEAIKDY